MILQHAWLLGFGTAALLLLLGATSGLVNAKLWISEPLVCAAFGVAIGPAWLGLLSLDPVHNPQAHMFLREAARITLAIAVLAAAIRLPQGWIRRHWRGLAVALGPGMVLMWAAGALVAAASFALPWRICALIGAVIAPTDPVLSAPVVSGALARRAVPADLRHAITAESAINDGLAGPIVMLPVIALSTRGTWHAIGLHWLLHAVLWDVGTALLLGAAAGYVARRLMRWAARQEHAERSSLLTIALALALAVMCGLQAVGGNGVLGAFVAGAVLNDGYDSANQEHQEHFNEAITRFFDLPIMILLGVAAPWGAWAAMGWHALAFVACVLLLRRMPAWLLLRQGMPWARRLPYNLFAGWFGPIGAAAMFYALTAQDSTGLQTLWPIVSLAAAASVVAHGITGTPVTAFLHKKESASFLKKRSKKLLT
jgi:NhaP-type Na+/H+ or K+/H+ antiporter